MRLGFVLADIDTGASTSLWPSVAKAFEVNKDALFVFPTGRLSSTKNSESMRNTILRLANSGNIQGAIIWASSIMGSKETYKNLMDMPIVTLGGKIDDNGKFPDVSFDAYDGIKRLIHHCVKIHGSKKIAFLQGPEIHLGAKERYKAYCDALKENNITFDPLLVSDPKVWFEGNLSIRQLLSERRLVPGRDFDTVICASDLIMYKAYIELISHGYRVPDDVKLCGFNDSAEAHLLEASGTTVKVPYDQMGTKAVETLYKTINSNSTEDLRLATECVFRKSCGCNNVETFVKQTQFMKYIHNETERNKHFNDFKYELMKTNTFDDIEKVISDNACNLGFEKVYFVVYEGEEKSILIENNSKTEFDYNLLLPYEIIRSINSGVWVAEPLFSESELIGHLVIKTSDYDGIKCEELRTSVSSALKSAILFEETIRAKQSAENAEMARTHFFAELSDTVMEPINRLKAFVSENKTLQAHERQCISSDLEKIGNMIELALGETGELELHCKICSLSKILEHYSTYSKKNDLPYMYIDEAKLSKALALLTQSSDNVKITASAEKGGVEIKISNTEKTPDEQDIKLVQTTIILMGGTIKKNMDGYSIVLPYPSLSGEIPKALPEGFSILCFGSSYKELGSHAIIADDSIKFIQENNSNSEIGALYWNCSQNKTGMQHIFSLLCSNAHYSKLPFICTDCMEANNLEKAIRLSFSDKKHTIMQIGGRPEKLYSWLQDPEIIVSSFQNVLKTGKKKNPSLILICEEDISIDPTAIKNLVMEVRSSRFLSDVPILVLANTITKSFVNELSNFPNLLLTNYCMSESEEFALRISSVLDGSEILPPLTGALVKKAQEYICQKATTQISRWQIANNVNVSEDYLTRVFKKELGISPWDYLNRYRISLAERLLKNTSMTISEVANATGFQEQAYFCRVFKKQKGFVPGRIRGAKKSELYKI